MNPLTLLPAKARLWVYAAVTLAALVWAAYDASDGDWKTFAGKVIGALVALTAASNVSLPGDESLED